MKYQTEFQRKVYEVVQKIPKGKVMTYAQVAKAMGNPNSARAVGNALNKNMNSDVPCHRVIRSSGEIGGFNDGTPKKVAMLKREGYPIAETRGNLRRKTQKN